MFMFQFIFILCFYFKWWKFSNVNAQAIMVVNGLIENVNGQFDFSICGYDERERERERDFVSIWLFTHANDDKLC